MLAHDGRWLEQLSQPRLPKRLVQDVDTFA
jgi:hypothetical protein